MTDTNTPIRRSYYCHQHPERGWTDSPCDHEDHRGERFARFLRELVGLPTEREIATKNGEQQP